MRITAAPNTSLFDGGVRYLQNSVVVENQTQPYSACMAQLLTKTDVAGTHAHARAAQLDSYTMKIYTTTVRVL